MEHGEQHTDKEAGRTGGNQGELNSLNIFRGRPVLEREAIVEAAYYGFVKGFQTCRSEPADVKASQDAIVLKGKDYLRETLPSWLLNGIAIDDLTRKVTRNVGYADTAGGGTGMESRR
jgi:hypothetical protein